MFRGKGLIITLSTLISVLILSILPITVYKIIKNNNNPDLQASVVLPDQWEGGGGTATNAYVITDTTGLTNNYSSYSEFHINSLAGLKAFGSNVYYASSYDQSFSGKTVKLTADIDCGGEVIQIGVTSIFNGRLTTEPTFAGTFDGNGKTISNYKLSTYSVSVGGYSISGNTIGQAGRGLFFSVSGTIKNLKVKNVTTEGGVSGGSHGHSVVFQSALVGVLEGGTITNCMAEGFSGAYYACGIVAVAVNYAGTVTNCYATDITGLQSNTGGSVLYGIGPASDKIFNGSPTSYKYVACSISNCVTTGLEISVLSSTNCHKTAKTTTGLDHSYLFNSSSVWYYHGNYNGGYPYLRSFVEWKEFTLLKGTNASDVTFSLNGSSLPTNAQGNQYFLVPNVDSATIINNTMYTAPSASSGRPSIRVLDQVITSDKLVGSFEVKWQKVSDFSYRINYNRKTKNVKFSTSNINLVNIYVNGNPMQYVEEVDFDIYVGDKIKFEITESYVLDYKHKELKYSFTDSIGESITITFVVVDNKYCIPSVSVDGSNKTYFTNHREEFTVSSNKIFIVNVEEKSYELDFE